MLHWFQKQLITREAAERIDECAFWAIATFGAKPFWQHTQLILPNEQFFPDKVNGIEPMAQYVLARVAALSGVSDWPWQLRDGRRMGAEAPPILGLPVARRFETNAPAAAAYPVESEPRLPVPFVVDQARQPQDLVASLAHTCAQHMLWQSQETPPGGLVYFEPASEILAHFCGFGLMLTNTAYTYRGACGRSYNPRANRQASLSESESIYALALFCQLKSVPTKTVFQYLKPHLKNSYKVALKQVRDQERAQELIR
ncbi:hypothetical protein [Marinimicrobium sp. C2-29]|uniref:hypothetical protein n=1 Tax=Marinimicrobium sp. C2-29 TaxID=3139825 RepID=UPI0031387E09